MHEHMTIAEHPNWDYFFHLAGAQLYVVSIRIQPF